MARSAGTDVARLHVPPGPEQIATMRSFVGSIGRHLGCGEEAIDDFRLAVSEVAAQALDERTAPDGFDLRAWYEEGGVILEVEPAPRFDPARRSADPLDPASGDRRRALISALFPDAGVGRDGSGGVLRLSAPCAGA